MRQLKQPQKFRDYWTSTDLITASFAQNYGRSKPVLMQIDCHTQSED